MGKVGRPPSIDSPPCPDCETADDVVSHQVREVEGELRRAFRCNACSSVFVPGFADDDGPSDQLKAAVHRVRDETEAPYRLIARALSRQLGVDVSHTTVGSWCRQDPPTEIEDDDIMACEYLSVLWALRHEIRDEERGDGSG